MQLTFCRWHKHKVLLQVLEWGELTVGGKRPQNKTEAGNESQRITANQTVCLSSPTKHTKWSYTSLISEYITHSTHDQPSLTAFSPLGSTVSPHAAASWKTPCTFF